jgi:hypothetical protein
MEALRAARFSETEDTVVTACVIYLSDAGIGSRERQMQTRRLVHISHTAPNCFHSMTLNRTTERPYHEICAHEQDRDRNCAVRTCKKGIYRGGP